MRIMRAIQTLLAVALAATAIRITAAPPPPPDLSATPREEMWAPNGPVLAIARVEDKVYIGGGFDYIGPVTGHGAAVDLASGQVAPAFPEVNGVVYSCVSDGAGGWFIGGYFTRVGAFERNSLARILSDGTVDPDWNPGTSGENGAVVYALKISGGTLYVGGYFNLIGGQPRNNLAAVDTATGTVTDWNPDADASVNAMDITGSTLYIGGNFLNVGGKSRQRLAAVSLSTGIATDFDADSNATVNALALSGSVLYVGGDFTTIRGASRLRIAAVNSATGAVTDWNPGGITSYGWVNALAVSGTTVYVGGQFTIIGGKNRDGLAAIEAGTGLVTDWDPADSYAIVYSILVSGSTIYVGGYFNWIGGQPRERLAELDATTGLASDWNPCMGDSVLALAISGSRLYAGGDFMSAGGVVRWSLAAMDAATGRPTEWDPGVNGSVNCLTRSGNTLYVGGCFDEIAGQSRDALAAFDLTNGQLTGWDPITTSAGGTTYYVYDIEVSPAGTTVYVAGDFDIIGGQPRKGLAVLSAATGLALPVIVDMDDGKINALLLSGGTLYVGGSFNIMGGQPRRGLAALNVSTGKATAWNPCSTGAHIPTVYALALSGTTLYVGGAF
ncbi:MAG: hypothetical protein NTX50_28890, partial [Candidatus Sumerlaeota bacterium]|nr:hypothetical protein [Candidatus Sumerlaeota bacterium]